MPSDADQSNNPKMRRLTFIVWNEFVKKTIDMVHYAICSHCDSKLKGNSKWGQNICITI